jgi:hypothetical protein
MKLRAVKDTLYPFYTLVEFEDKYAHSDIVEVPDWMRVWIANVNDEFARTQNEIQKLYNELP